MLGAEGKLYPCPDPEHDEGTEVMFGDGFPTADGRARFVPAVHAGADELPDDLTGTVGVTAGASAPEDLVFEVLDRLDPADRPLLDRDGDIWKAQVLYRIKSGERHVFEPALRYTNWDLDGAAMAHAGPAAAEDCR